MSSVSVRALVVALQDAEQYYIPRTIRALSRVGVAVESLSDQDPHPGPLPDSHRLVYREREEMRQLARVLRATDRPVWLIRAGAWPADNTVRFPPSSSTGRPLCALGAMRVPSDSDSTLSSLHPFWSRWLQVSGGDLDRPVDHDPHVNRLPHGPTLASIYLEAALAAAVGQRLESARFDDALQDGLRACNARIIRWPAFDVCQDGRWRVAEMITSLQLGGAERMVLDLVAALPQHYTHARVITTGRPARSAFPAPGGTIDVSTASGGREGRMQAAADAALAMHADVLHVHLLNADDLAVLKDTGIPVLMTVHNTRPGWPEGMASLDASAVAMLAACSTRVEQEIREAGLAVPVRTIWNGIDFDAYQSSPLLHQAGAAMRTLWGLADTDYALLALANPRPQKRLDRLPAILALVRDLLRQRRPDCRVKLIIAGQTSDCIPEAQQAQALLAAQIQQHQLASDVLCLGPIENVPALIHACNALVSVSAWEGMSLAILEALAGGLPVVATDTGGTDEIARGNPAVKLLPLDFSDAQAADTIIEVLLNPPTGGRAAAHVHFRHQRMAERYAQLFPRVIQGFSPFSRRSQIVAGDGGAPSRSPLRGERAPICDRRLNGLKDAGLWLITNNFSTGGAQSSARRLLTALANRGHRVRAAVAQEQADFPTPGRQALQAAGIRVLPLPPDGAMAQLLAAIDADPPQSVIMWNLMPAYKVLLADLLLDVLLFDVSPGEMYFASLERYLAALPPAMPYRSPRQYGARLAGVIVKYGAEYAKAEQFLGAPVTVIPNGVPVPDALPTRAHRSDHTLIIGTAARISPQKKLEELISALRLVHDRMPPYILRIAGGIDGHAEAYLEQLKSLADGLPIRWLGDVSDISAFLADLDMFVMISEPAGCPNASLEAMAAGLPVIATDFGGVAEQVVDGITGRLTPRGEVPVLANALLDAARNPRRLRQWGQEGWQRARQLFSLERMVEDYQRVLFP